MSDRSIDAERDGGLAGPDPRRSARRHEAARREAGVRVLDLERVDLDATQHRAVSMLLLLGLAMDVADLHVVPEAAGGEAHRLRVRYYLDDSSGEAKPVPGDDFGDLPALTTETREGERVVREIPPLPEELTPHVARVLRWLAGVDSPRGRLARALRRLANAIDGGPFDSEFGRFAVRIGSRKGDVLVGVYPSPEGDRFILRFGPLEPRVAPSSR